MKRLVAASCIAAAISYVTLQPSSVLDMTNLHHSVIQEHPDLHHAPRYGKVTVIPLPRDYPECLDEIAASIGERMVFVDKSESTASVYEYVGGAWLIEGKYKVALGSGLGPKQRSGDRKTPEGRYTISRKMSIDGPYQDPYLSYLNALRIDGRTRAFGDHTLEIDYPNLADRAMNYSGSGIMFHAADGEIAGKSTAGCIALAKQDMASLFNLVDKGAAVIIVPGEAKRK